MSDISTLFNPLSFSETLLSPISGSFWHLFKVKHTGGFTKKAQGITGGRFALVEFLENFNLSVAFPPYPHRILPQNLERDPKLWLGLGAVNRRFELEQHVMSRHYPVTCSSSKYGLTIWFYQGLWAVFAFDFRGNLNFDLQAGWSCRVYFGEEFWKYRMGFTKVAWNSTEVRNKMSKTGRFQRIIFTCSRINKSNSSIVHKILGLLFHLRPSDNFH